MGVKVRLATIRPAMIYAGGGTCGMRIRRQHQPTRGPHPEFLAPTHARIPGRSAGQMADPADSAHPAEHAPTPQLGAEEQASSSDGLRLQLRRSTANQHQASALRPPAPRAYSSSQPAHATSSLTAEPAGHGSVLRLPPARLPGRQLQLGPEAPPPIGPTAGARPPAYRPCPRRRCPRSVSQATGPRWWVRTEPTTSGCSRSTERRRRPSYPSYYAETRLSFFRWAPEADRGGGRVSAAWPGRST